MYYATRDYKDFNIYEKAPSVSNNHEIFTQRERGFGYKCNNTSCVNALPSTYKLSVKVGLFKFKIHLFNKIVLVQLNKF